MLAAGAHMGDSIKPELHRSVIEVGSPVCADIREARGRGDRPAALAHRARGQGGRAHRGRGHPSHQPLEGPGDHRPRALRGHRHRDGGPGPREPHLRPARARGHRGPRDADPDHERRARLPAPPAGPVRELALLVRPPHRREVGALHDLQALPAHADPRLLPLLGRVLPVRGPAGAHRLHRRRQEDLVGHPAPRVLQHPRVPHLRHALAGGGDDRHRRRRPGPGRRRSTACWRATSRSACRSAR